MGKDLFGDLTADVSDKYKNKNEATIIAELTEHIDTIVKNLSKETREHLWAEVVIETYEKEYAENKDYIESVPSFKTLYELKKEAEKFLEDEVAVIERNKNLQAKAIDDKIRSLINSAKGKFWCEDVDALVKEINSLKDEVRVRCKKLGEIDQLKQDKEKILRAIKVDDEISQLEKTKTKTRSWCNSVISFNDILDANLTSFLTKKIVLDELLSQAKEYLVQIEAEEVETKKQEELKKQEEIRKQAELKARLYEQELAKKKEQERRAIEEKNAEINKSGKEKLQSVIASCKEPSFEFKAEGREVHLVKCTNNNLKKIVIPEGVDRINDSVFSDFRKLVSVALPESLLSIGNYAFQNCIKLKEINLNGCLQEINECAFKNCISLKSIYIGSKVEKISSTAFFDCIKLKEINVSGDSDTYTSEGGNLYSKDKKVLYRYCPANKIKNVLIHISVDYVHNYAFQGCRNIKTINTNTVNVLGSYVFTDCIKLSKIKIGSYVKVIRYGCFKNCKKLKSIKASNGIFSQGTVENHFVGCKKLSKKYRKWFVSVDPLKRNYVDNLVYKYKRYM